MADAERAIACGVDAIGVILATESPRRVTFEIARDIARAVPAFVTLVGVVVEPREPDIALIREAGYLLQFSGDEPADRCESLAGGRYIKVHHLAVAGSVSTVSPSFETKARDYRHASWLFDTAVDGKRGGTGRTFDWSAVRQLAGSRPVIMSGGLTPENVGRCVAQVRPFGVDVRSGIETNGVQDFSKMRAFVRAVKEVDEQA